MTDPRLEDLLDDDDTPEERETLAHVHARLLAAGAPPELPPGLQEPPAPPSATVVALPRRRRYTAVAAAVAAGVVLFGAGYLVAGGTGPATPVQTVALSGLRGATGSLALFEKDAAGNWPMELTVSGLPRLPAGATYELWLTRAGRPSELCGTFVVAAGETTVRMNAAYRLRDFDGWIVRSGLGAHRTVLRTTTT